jgi:nitrate reductase beta subunit
VWRRSMVRTRKPKGWYMVIPSPVLKHLKLQWKHAFAESCFLRSAVANSELGTLCEKGVGTSHYWLPMLFPKHSQCQLKEIFKTWDVLHEICCIVLWYIDPIPIFIQF